MNMIFQIIGFVLPVLTVCLIAYLAWWWSRKQRSRKPNTDKTHASLDSEGGVESPLAEANEVPILGDEVEVESPDDVALSTQQTVEDSGQQDGRRVEIVSDFDIDSIVSQLSSDESVLAEVAAMADDSTTVVEPESEVPSDTAFDMPNPEMEPPISTEGPVRSASIPPVSIPRRRSGVGEVASPASDGAVDLDTNADQWHSRPIPPRRGHQPESSVISLHDVDVDDDSGEIRVVAANEVPDSLVTKAEYAETQDELEQLRLALEASHQELSHLTVARDQALSRASRQESQLASFQSQISEIEGSQAGLQSERETLAGLVGELKANTESLQSELQDTREKLTNAEQQLTDNSSEAIQQIETQHQATVDELRSILGSEKPQKRPWRGNAMP